MTINVFHNVVILTIFVLLNIVEHGHIGMFNLGRNIDLRRTETIPFVPSKLVCFDGDTPADVSVTGLPYFSVGAFSELVF